MLEQLIEFMEILTYSLIKDRDEEPDEEIYRARSERVSSARAPAPGGLGCIILLCDVSQSESSLNPVLLEFLWRLSHFVRINY